MSLIRQLRRRLAGKPWRKSTPAFWSKRVGGSIQRPRKIKGKWVRRAWPPPGKPDMQPRV